MNSLVEIIPESWVAEQAIDDLIVTSKFFPTVAEIVDRAADFRERNWVEQKATEYQHSGAPELDAGGRFELGGQVEQEPERSGMPAHVRELLNDLGLPTRAPVSRMDRTNEGYWKRLYGDRAYNEAHNPWGQK